MTKLSTLNLTQNINTAAVTFVNADVAATLKTLLTAGADDEIVKCLQFTSDDSTARVVDVLLNIGGTDYLLGSVNVPINSGTNGTVSAVDAFATLMPGLPVDALGKRVLPLKAGTIVKLRNQTQMTAAKTLTATIISEKF